MELFLLVVVSAAAFGLFAFWGYQAIRSTSWASFAGLALLWGGFTLVMFLAISGAKGWDGLIYAIGLICLSAPSAIGAGVGALTGWLKQGRDHREAFT